MFNQTAELLPRILTHRLPLSGRPQGLDAGENIVYPNYDGLSLINIPAAICGWLGVPPIGAPGLLAEATQPHDRIFRRVVLLVVDGMGLNTLQAAFESAVDQPDLAVWGAFDAVVPLTSITPSTTAAALTSLWTGLPPSRHGVMAYEVWLKEYGLIANLIRHAPVGITWEPGSLAKSGFDPLSFLPVPTLGPHLQHHGIHTTAFQHFSIARSGLSNMLMRDVDIKPFRSLSDLWVSLEALLAANTDERAYTYIYWGDLDEHSHLFGPDDPRTALEFAAFSRQFAAFLRRLRAQSASQDTLLLVTADHGHLSTPRQSHYELRNHPDLRDCLVMYPSGEARLPFAYLRPGREEAFLRYIERTWPDEFIAVSSDQALQAGWFGGPPFYERVPDRIGDFIVVPRSDAYWFFGDRENVLQGRHGGMSRTEMLVPLLSMVL